MDNQQPQGDAGARTTKVGLLEIRTSEYRGAWLVDVRGELDLANIGTLENELGCSTAARESPSTSPSSTSWTIQVSLCWRESPPKHAPNG
jgi:hypothetical protein